MENKELQSKFLALAKKYELVSDEASKIRDELHSVMADLGIDTYVQDPDTKAVYKVHRPTGTFIFFRDLDYKRTALEGEKGGHVLSKKEATDAGFVLK